MNTFDLRKKNTGIGLIEVLIATVVIAVGLLAIATLQGNLIGSSRENKTRAEAKALADAKIEQLRDNIVKTGGYDNLPASAGVESNIGGVTETFDRETTVAHQLSPDRQEVSVTVCWPSSGDCPPANNKDHVIVQSVIAYDDIGNAAKNLKDSQTASTLPGGPSTNAQSSNEITETKKVAEGNPGTYIQDDKNQNKIWIRQDSRTQAIAAYTCSSPPIPPHQANVDLSAFENGLMTRRIDYDGLAGNEAIELYEQVTLDGVQYCIPRIRFNGGVIIPIRGIVHSGATIRQGHDITYLDVNLFTFNASETGAYCVFKPSANAKSAPYTCYVGGNCSGFTCSNSEPFTCNDDDVTQCPTGSYAAAIVGPGGWRGKVGLLGVASSSSGFRNVCFQEEIAAVPDTLDTARNYYSLRNAVNEGINKPYSCHDFLIIDGQSTNPKIHDECVKQANAIGGFVLASKTIQRNIPSDQENLFDPAIDTAFCAGTTGTSYSIAGVITGAASAPTVTVTDGTTTETCAAVTANSYTCAITSTANSVTIGGVYNNQPLSCTVAISSNDTTPDGCTLAFTAKPTYTITGHIRAPSAATANAVSLEVQDTSNIIACTNNQDFNNTFSTYSCVIATDSTSVDIHATAASGYTVAPASHTVSSLSGVTSNVVVTSPDNDFVAAVVPVYTISGTITLGNTVDNLTAITLNPTNPAPGCTLAIPNGGWQKNTTHNYSCSIYGGANTITVTISPICSNTKVKGNPAPKKYTITGGAGQSSTGSLVIDLGDVNGNRTVNITIAESAIAC